MVTLGNAAKTLKISKPTISKAIAKGQLSATRREDGSFAIDPSELMRWWEGVRHRFQPLPVYEFQGATPSDDTGNGQASTADTGNPADTSNEVAARLAALEEQVRGLKELIAEVKRSREQTEADRDHWRDQAARAVKALPAPEAKPAESAPPPRSWWPWRRSA